MEVNEVTQSYKPQINSRRGEAIAWVLAVICMAAWVVLKFVEEGPVWLAFILSLLLVISALAVSLSNFIDRKSVIRLNSKTVSFSNGLRSVTMDWEAIEEVSVHPAQWGARKIQVVSAEGYFVFETRGKVIYRDELRGKTGYEQGDLMLKAILENSKLELLDTAKHGGEYYGRK